MRRVDHQLERWIYDRARFFGIDVLLQFSRTLDVCEKCVTVLRSPSTAALFARSAVILNRPESAAAHDEALSAPRWIPRGLQKWALGGFWAPHFSQRAANRFTGHAELGI